MILLKILDVLWKLVKKRSLTFGLFRLFFVSLKNSLYSIERDSCNFGAVFEQVTQGYKSD